MHRSPVYEVTNSRRPGRSRPESQRQSDLRNQESQLLCIEDVLSMIAMQQTYSGGVNCQICGKLYKSKVCFIKHVWEHTVYWPMFEGIKNQDRVLSIQAAIILCCFMGNDDDSNTSPDLCNLLVTYPHLPDKKVEREALDKKCLILKDDNSPQNDKNVQNNSHHDLRQLSSRKHYSKYSYSSCDRRKRKANHGGIQTPDKLSNFLQSANTDGQSLGNQFIAPNIATVVSQHGTRSEMVEPLQSLQSHDISLPISKPDTQQSADSSGRGWNGFGVAQYESNIGESFVSPLKRKRED